MIADRVLFTYAFGLLITNLIALYFYFTKLRKRG